MRSSSRQSTVVSRQSTVVSRRSLVGLGVIFFVGLGFSRATLAQQYTFEQVASGLKHQDAATRLRAIEILKEADYPEAAAPIAALIGDSDDRVQFAAIDAERALFTSRVVPRRRKIGFVVEVRSVAGGDAAATGQLGLKARRVPTEVLSGLTAALRDNNPRIRAEAINLAALLGADACAVGLKADTTDAGRRAACDQIGNALVDNINSRDAVLRRAAMHALGQLRYSNAVQALADQLSFYGRGADAIAALEGLAGIGHSTSVTIFEDLLANSNVNMRRFAIEGLARAGNRESLPALQQMGQSEQSAAVLLALHYANVKLDSSADSLRQLVAALSNGSLRPVAISYLLDASTTSAPALAESLKDPSADVRRLIADILGFSRNATVIPALESAARDSDPDVAAAARQAIERVKLGAG